jgi:hypothetical protein
MAEEKTVAVVTPSETYYDSNAEIQSLKAEEESVSAKAKETGQSLKELVAAMSRKARAAIEEKTKDLDKVNPSDISAAQDAKAIGALGEHVELLIRTFEDVMTGIRKEPYDEQARLLNGYKKLLEEQINVINSRIDWSKRLKK